MTPYPVVVGIDDSPAALHAVDLAVREARLRNLAVRIVYATSPDTPPSAAELRVVEEALRRVGGQVPATADILGVTPAGALVQESKRAVLLVVGHGRRVNLPLAGLGSVARRVATEASCPVLVARGELDRTGDVVLGVDGSPAAEAAVGFAFEEAALRRIGLVALHAWTGPVSTGPGDMLPLVYDPVEVVAEEERVLAEALAGWRAKYPDVAVQRRLVRGHAARALVWAAQTAALVVVGRHGYRVWPGWLVGSVTHALLHQARCPIAVIHEVPLG